MSKPSFEAKMLSPEIVLVTFEEREEMCETLLRIQEHYENPHFKGKIFTRGEIKSQMMKESGMYDFPEWVDGCNFPAAALIPFFIGLFDPLTDEEQLFIDRVCRRSGDFYVIAVYEGADPDTLEHEVCHALYGTNIEYKMEMDELLHKYREEIEPVKEYVLDQGYHMAVVLDECHAYITADSSYLSKEKDIELDNKMVEEFRQVLSIYKPEVE